jgi:16S rRNA G966 N2-methylase RsmD
MKVAYGSISVNFTEDVDGGGRKYESEFALVIRKLFGGVDSLCEFGAGPGFIGFSALARGLCKRLCLIDINPMAIELCKKTVIENGLVDKVRVFHSNVLSNVPKSEKWDLVVWDPPFHKSPLMDGNDIRWVDDNWKVRREFYATIHEHLNPGSSIIFMESTKTGSPSLWRRMIANSPNLELVKCFRVRSSTFTNFPRPGDLWGAGKRFISVLERLRPGQLGEFVHQTPFLFWPFSMFQSYFYVWSRLTRYQEGTSLDARRHL